MAGRPGNTIIIIAWHVLIHYVLANLEYFDQICQLPFSKVYDEVEHITFLDMLNLVIDVVLGVARF